jgi:hypothetical protein
MPTLKRIFILAIFLGLALTERSLGQEKGTPITFHVTAVRSEEAQDWCTTGECTATRFTVEGYSDATEYVLDCVETMVHKPSPHFTTVCVRLHAHNDYAARLFPDAITFGDSKRRSSDEPLVVVYHIVSEKEVNKQKR